MGPCRTAGPFLVIAVFHVMACAGTAADKDTFLRIIQNLRKLVVLLLRAPCFAKFTCPYFRSRRGGSGLHDHSAVSTVRLGVQSRRPKAASPPQELEVRAAGGRANF
jgi:hypothetical protein